MSDRPAEAFEAALRDNPDDLVTWSVYADYLEEQGDPRGEFMRVQLALEDESLPKAERDALKKQETDLLAAHRREWLGPAVYDAHFRSRRAVSRYASSFIFRRGWIWEVVDALIGGEMPLEEFAQVPELRWVQAIGVAYPGDSLAPLAGAVFAPVLRSFTLGWDEDNSTAGADGLADFLRTTPRLERLTLSASDVNADELFRLPLPNLTELAVHCLRHYPTDILADNPSLTRLRTIDFHPHAYVNWQDPEPYLTAADLRAVARSPHLRSLTHLRFVCCNAGDEGCDVLAQSGLIRRLEVLDLSHGCVTDEGAFTLVRALREGPHNLRLVRLEDNALTGDGIAALRAAGVTVEAPDQHGPGDDGYLMNGDIE